MTALGAFILLLGSLVLLRELLVPRIRTAIDSVRSEGPALLVLSYLFASDEGAGHGWFSRWFSQERRTEIDSVWRQASERLTRWVWAQGAIAAYFAVVFGGGLALLGEPYALTIGIVGGVREIVPYLGGITAVVLAVVSALTVDLWTAVWVVLFYLVVAAEESHVIAPFLDGRGIGLRSAWVLIALVLGAKAEGVLGVLFAVQIRVDPDDLAWRGSRNCVAACSSRSGECFQSRICRHTLGLCSQRGAAEQHQHQEQNIRSRTYHEFRYLAAWSNRMRGQPIKNVEAWALAYAAYCIISSRMNAWPDRSQDVLANADREPCTFGIPGQERYSAHCKMMVVLLRVLEMAGLIAGWAGFSCYIFGNDFVLYRWFVFSI